MGRIEQIRDKFTREVEFFVVYVREAHPTDGWQVDANVQDEVFYRQHQSYEEREEVAQTLQPRPQDHASRTGRRDGQQHRRDFRSGAGAVVPDWLGRQGRLPRRRGPFFFDLDEWEQAIQDCVDGGGTIKGPAKTTTAA